MGWAAGTPSSRRRRQPRERPACIPAGTARPGSSSESRLPRRSSCPPGPTPAWCRADRRRCGPGRERVQLHTSLRGPNRSPPVCNREWTNDGCRSPWATPTFSQAWFARRPPWPEFPQVPRALPLQASCSAWVGPARPAPVSPPAPGTGAGIAAEIPRRSTRGGVIAEVFRVDLPNGEQRLEAVLAARILMPQEFIFADGRTQVFLSGLELAAHGGQDLGHRNHAGVGFAGSGRHVIDLAIRVRDALVIATGAFLLWAAV